MNTDKNKKFNRSEYFGRELCFAMAHVTKSANVNSRPVCLNPFLSVLFLSVFICVHPWFQSPAYADAHTLTGIDVLEEQNFAPLAGKRVGLITNQTGIDRNGRSTIDLLAHAPRVKLVALFSPEHGIRGNMDENVASSTDPATGVPIYSLYGE